MPNKTWIEEQEENVKMFTGAGSAGEAIKLLEHSQTNRDITVQQAKIYTAARIFGLTTGFNMYCLAADYCEHAQMNIDDKARLDYMKVAIEQWQGKIQANAKKNLQALI